MKRTFFQYLFISFFLWFAGTASANNFNNRKPAGFIENKGQYTNTEGRIADEVLFMNELHPGFYVVITTSGLSYISLKQELNNTSENNTKIASNSPFPNLPQPSMIEWTRTDVTLLNATISKVNTTVSGASLEYTNYYNAGNSISNVYSFQSILIKNIYPNIDWKIYKQANHELKYDFIIHPGGDPAQIKMKYEGAELSVTNQQLIFSNPLCKVSEGSLYTYNDVSKAKLNSKYVLNENNVSFNVSSYNKTQTIVIDPPLELIWATYFGGNEGIQGSYDLAHSIETDSKDNVYICGVSPSFTTSFPFKNPNKGNYYNGSFSGGLWDAYIAKFDKYNRLLWCTYYGGAATDFFTDLALDKNDNLFVVGYSNSPTKTGNKIALVNPGNGSYFDDTFYNGIYTIATKFDTTGILKWATVYGNNNESVSASACTVDNEGSLYITGYVSGSNFKTKPSVSSIAFFQNTPGDNDPNQEDIFIMKFGPVQELQWATYWGGTGREQCYDMCSDNNNNIFIVGRTLTSTGCYTYAPTSGGTPFFSSTPKYSFALSFDKDLNPRWCTYYGGVNDLIHLKGVTCDSKNNIILTGSSAGDDMPKPTVQPPGSYNQLYSGVYTDVMITKLNPKFEVIWSTHLGKGGTEVGYKVVTDKIDNIFILGINEIWPGDQIDCPLLDAGNGAFYQPTYGGSYADFLLAMFDSVGVRKWTTYYGGSGTDWRQQGYSWGMDVTINSQNNFYAIGCTQSPNNTLVDPAHGAYKQTYKGQFSDAMILRFGEEIKVTSTQSNNICFKDSLGTATANTTGGNTPYTYSWSTTPAQTTQTATGLNAGTYTVEVFDATGLSNIDTILIKGPTQIKFTTYNHTDSQCGVDNGTAQVAVTGGVSSYTYSWNTGATTNSISNLAQGEYTVTITDSKGCTKDTTVFINGILTSTVTLTSTPTNCQGQSTGTAHASLNPGGTFSYTWNTTPVQTDSIATGLSTGTYTVIISDANNCSTTKTVTVGSSTNTLSFTSVSPSHVYCPTDTNGAASVVVAQGQNPLTYSWSNGDTTNAISGLTQGTYTLTVTDANDCTLDTTVSINNIGQPMIITETHDSLSCPNDSDATASINVTNGQGSLTYSWNTGETINSLNGLTAGNYSVLVTDSKGCTATQSLTIAAPAASYIDAGENQIIESGSSATLAPSGGSSYTWTPSDNLSCTVCENSVATPSVTTTYILNGTSINGCLVSDSVLIVVEPICGELFVPTAFSPNGDAVNDLLFIRTNCLATLQFIIYNRWGEKVFETTDYTVGWDGKFKGSLCDPGIFVYYINATTTKGETVDEKGNITLVR